MTVLYFGSYNPNYSRNGVLINGLRQNGVEVLECRDDSPGIKKFINLYRKHRQLKKKYDVMIVGFLGQQMVPFAKLISKKPIIFDSFLSLYDSNIFDRKTAKKGSLRAFYYWMLDWLSMKLADVVIFDTDQHINYASKEFGIKKSKFRRIWIGARDDVFYPMDKPFDMAQDKSGSDKFLVIFHGSFIPLQGIEYLLKAAKICEKEDISFLIVGDGQEKKKMLNLAGQLNLKNVEFAGFMSLEWIREKISQSDICLGIFTPAIRELFDEEDLMLVKVADSESLADGIISLKRDPDLMNKIAINGYNKFKDNASIRVLGEKLNNIVNEFE